MYRRSIEIGLQNKIASMKDVFRMCVPDFVHIRNFIAPRRGKFITESDNIDHVDGRHKYIIDGTPIRAWRIMAAGMQSGMSSRTRRWFSFGLPDPALEDYGPVKEWLTSVEDITYRILSITNYYNQIHSIYEEQGAFGNGLMMIMEHPDNVIYYNTHTCGTYFYLVNEYNDVDSVVRLVAAPNQVITDKFGKLLDDAYKNKDKQDAAKMSIVAELIEPNANFNPNRIDKFSWKYSSTWMTWPDMKLIKNGGYREKPFAAPRWGTATDDLYSEGLGHDVLGDAMMLQEETRDKLRAIQKMIDPPVNAPSGMKGRVRHIPRAVNYVKAGQEKALRATYQIDFRLDAVRSDIEEVRQQIKQGYMNDLFLFVQSNPYATATEILEKHEEKVVMLGPAVESQEIELYDPSLSRTVSLGIRAGKFPPPPPELLEEFARGNVDRIKIDYVSALAQAQKKIRTNSIRETAGFVINEMMPLDEMARFMINVPRTIRNYADANGTPQGILNSEDEYAQAVQNFQNQQAEAQAMQKQAMDVDAASKLGNVDMSKPNLLSDQDVA